ncbi:MAG: c-type cytochrome [Anaerolineae bacterium]
MLARLFKEMMAPEQRALLGTLVFFLMIVVIGWQAINEPSRLGTFLDQYEGRSIERGAVLFADNCASCHGPDATGVQGRGPGLAYDSFWDGTRLEEVAWAGTQYDFIYLTVAAGRPVVHPSYAENMPTWSQEYGGPMRPDQVRDVVAYVMNFGNDPVPDAQAVMPIELAQEIEIEEVGGDVVLEDALAAAALTGDPDHGEALFSGAEMPEMGTAELGCLGCHSLDGTTVVGPSILGVDERYLAYEDYMLPDTLDENAIEGLYYYLVEAIWYPNNYVSEGFVAGQMPADFRDQMSTQDLADIIAYILQVNE